MTPIRSGFARTNDDLHLYYRVVGEGPPMVCCNGVGVSTFFFKYIVEHYRGRFSVILWDYRGHGRSGTPPDVDNADFTVQRCALDLRTVLTHLGMTEPAVLLGHSMGCQVILEFAKQFPDGVRGLVPMFGTFSRPLDTFFDFSKSRSIFEVLHKLATFGGRRGTRLMLPLYASPLAFKLGGLTGLVDRHYALEEDIRKYLEHLLHMDTRVFLRMVSLMADHDLTDDLPNIVAPTLVIAGEKDLFTPLHRSRKMVSLLPHAELMILAEASHAAIVEHPQTINRRLDRFLEQIED
jgi:pimeloyl-ACP methyl ester carboxylesterase